jgi:hypothetical protein
MQCERGMRLVRGQGPTRDEVLEQVTHAEPRHHLTKVDERPSGCRDRDGPDDDDVRCREVTRTMHLDAGGTKPALPVDRDLDRHVCIDAKPPVPCGASM